MEHWLRWIFQFLSPASFEEVLSLVKHKSAVVKEVWYTCAFSAMVEIWISRNRRMYEEAIPSIENVKQKILRFIKECSVRCQDTYGF